MKILIVDDVEANLYLLRVLFLNAGYEILEAENGKVALEVMETAEVDLIVSDILMPVMDGFELCKIWQSDERLKKIPFIFYTATYTEEKDRKFSLDLGADLFLVKPMESYNLLREIEKVLSQQSMKNNVIVEESASTMPDSAYYEEYSSRLVKKLETKLLQLEQKNHELLRRDANLRQLNDNLNFQLSKVQLTESSLREHENELLSIVDSMAEGVLTTDRNGVISEFNPSAEKILGYLRIEVIGKSIDMFIPESIQARHSNLMSSFVSGDDTNLVSRDMKAVTKDGVEVPIRLSVGRLPQGNVKREMFICTFLDVSKEKKQEEIIARSRKMEVIGNLSGGIAHDYNNMLGVVMGYSELLLDGTTDEKQRGYIDMILHAVDRGTSLTRKLLSMSKEAPESTERVNINDLISENIDVLKKLLLTKVELIVECGESVPAVQIDKNDFEDCLLNLCINAMHAIKDNGYIKLQTSSVILYELNESNLPAGRYLNLSIEDNGCGMNKETRERIFDPFFTTKGEKGTGLGLSQVYGFIKRSKGELKVETKEGVGTRFDFYFPEYIGEDERVEIDKAYYKKSVDDNRTIMVVDDEPVLLKLIGLYLEEAGSKVITASDGEECLSKLANERVDLVISDVIMPNMNGFELSKEIKSLYSGVDVVLMSGYNEKGKGYQLKKPFSKNELLEAVDNILAV